MEKTNYHKFSAVTLIELLTVIAVNAVLAAILIHAVCGQIYSITEGQPTGPAA